jgi:3-hydroxybutyrate dehydrogenase
MNLKGKICVITGGASGIGLEIARTFAAAGGKAAIADIDLDAAKKAATSIAVPVPELQPQLKIVS